MGGAVGRPATYPELHAAIEAAMDSVAGCLDLEALEDIQVAASRLILAVSGRQVRIIREEREDRCRLNAALEALQRAGLDGRRVRPKVLGPAADIEIDTTRAAEA